MPKKVIRYVTKYVLSQGIIRVEGKILGPGSVFFYGGQLAGNRGGGIDVSVPATDHFERRAEALARSHQILQKKIRSLEKQVDKLKSIREFPVIDMTVKPRIKVVKKR